MEFKPKKDAPSTKNHLNTPGSKASRPKPYSSQSTGGYGRNSNFRFRGVSSTNSTPSRFQHNSFKTRADKIMENSLRTEKDEPTKLNVWLNNKEHTGKRPLGPINTKAEQKHKDSDPYNVFSEDESDDEIFLSHKKTLKSTEAVNTIQKKAGVKPSGLFANKGAKANLFPNKESPKRNFYSNKENNIFGSPVKSSKSCSFKTYGSAKRKQYVFSKTKFKGVSPVKVERLYGEQEVDGPLWSTVGNEKENIPVPVNTEIDISDPLDSSVSEPHLIGFPNYGNTCYLNAVVQSLLALPSFTLDLQHLTSSLSPDRTSLFHSLGQVLHYRDKVQLKEVKAKLKLFKENVVRVDDSFSGFKMQDANEFLTRLMDTIKDEVERCHMTTPSPDHPSTSTERLNLTPEHPGTVQMQCYEPSSETEFSTHVDDLFEADFFGPTKVDDRELNKSDSVENNNCIKQKFNERNSNIEHTDLNKNERTSADSALSEVKKGSKDFNANKNSFNSPTREETHSNMCNSERVFPLDSINSPKTRVSEYSSENMQITPKDKSVSVEKLPRNPVKDNFEFQLLESYRCLSCSEVVGRNQEYFGLYVNLPEKEILDSSFDEDVKLTGEGLPTVQDAIDAYMSADERDLNCEKCGHDKAEVVTSATSLPRILVVQLKRYEYKPEMFESFKVSSRVRVNEWISLDKFITDDVAPIKLFSTDNSSVVPKAPKQATLTVRNLSSELNVEKNDENMKENKVIASPVNFKSPIKPPDVITVPSADQEDEELQEVMRRSMDDMGGPGTAQGVPNQEEDEIQQAIRLSLQDMGMSFSVENAEDSRDGFEKTKNEEKDVNMVENRHTYRLMSVISHFGLTTKTGHYVSDVYNVKENSWFHYDDETVTPITESVVTAGGRQKNGYIFFYIHRDLFEQLQKEDRGR